MSIDQEMASNLVQEDLGQDSMADMSILDDLPTEILLQVIQFVVKDETQLIRNVVHSSLLQPPQYNAAAVEPRLKMFATCCNRHQFLARIPSPGICRVGGKVGSMAISELLRTYPCRQIVSQFDRQSLDHLWKTMYYLTEESANFITGVDVHVLRYGFTIGAEALALWFAFFRTFAKHLSGKVTFSHEKIRETAWYCPMNEQQHATIIRVARYAMKMYERHGAAEKHL